MSDDKPREWEIYIDDGGSLMKEKYSFDSKPTRVIEYSAYERVVAIKLIDTYKFTELQIELDTIKDIFSEWKKILGNPDIPADAIHNLMEERDKLKAGLATIMLELKYISEISINLRDAVSVASEALEKLREGSEK